MNSTLQMILSLAPTILFILIVLLSTVFGILRGFRKNMILFIHSIVIFIICLILYFIFVNAEFFDKFLLDTINVFLGPDGLEEKLGVSAECVTLKEVLLEYIPIGFNYGDGISLLIKDNGQYLLTLIDITYHIVFAVFMTIVYHILVFIMHIIYFIFYPERRYKKKLNKKFSEAKSDRSYNKHPVYGGLIGFTRGLLSALLIFSLIGSLFYIVSGGKGEGTVDSNVSLGDDTADTVLDLYSEIESYGTKGIFKVLNSVTDKNDTPYYLYAADLIFQGELIDETRDINEKIYLREELKAYTSFARKTYNLVMKYGKKEITNALNGNSNEEMMDVIVQILSKEEFQNEFKLIINDFDSKTYFINLTLSLMDSIMEHIDEVSFMEGVDEKALEILKILFKKNYLSEKISYEQEMIFERNTLKNSSLYDPSRYELPYIKVSSILTKADTNVLFDVMMCFLQIDMDSYDTFDILEATLDAVAYIEDLSIFSDERKDEFDPILARLYSYINEVYLKSNKSTASYGYSTESIDNYLEFINSGVEWTTELKVLLGTTNNIYSIYKNVYNEEEYENSSNKDEYIINAVFDLFNKNSQNYYQNIENFDAILDNLSDSKILGKVLSTSFIYENIENALSSAIPNITLKEDIVYENTYDSLGRICYGEIYNVLKGIEVLAKNDGLDIIKSMLFDENIDTDKLLTDISNLLSKRQGEKSIIDYFLESSIIESIVSGFLINSKDSFGDFSLYIPDICLEYDDLGNQLNIIKKEILKDLFNKLPKLIKIIEPILNEPENMDNLNTILNDDEILNMLDNLVIEGTVSGLIKDYLIDIENIVISKELEDINSWVTVNSDGELKVLIKALKNSGIDLNSIFNGENQDVIDSLTQLTDESINTLLQSKIFYYSISNYLINNNTFDNIEIIIPNSSRIELEDDNIKYLLSKNELLNLISNLDLLLTDSSLTGLITNFVTNRDTLMSNKIILTTFVNYIVNNEEFNNEIGSTLVISESLRNQATKERLIEFTSYNKWNNESTYLLEALDELLGISNGELIDFTDESIKNKVYGSVKTLNDLSGDLTRTRLDIILTSEVMGLSVTKMIDDAFEGIVNETTLNNAKENDRYSKSELEAIVNAILIFDLDIENITVSDLNEKIKNEITTYNSPRHEERFNGRTTLNLLYQSYILKSIFTEEIDKQIQDILLLDNLLVCKDKYQYYLEEELEALINSLNILNIVDFNNSIDISSKITLINEENIDELYNSYIIVYAIKYQLDKELLSNYYVEKTVLDNSLVVTDEDRSIAKYYKKNEILSLLNSLKELEITDLNSFDTIDFDNLIITLLDNSMIFKGKSRLDVLYDSYIVEGFITKSILDQINTNEEVSLQDHQNAYEKAINVYRKCEIETLVKILDGKTIDEFDVEGIKLSDIKKYIYDDSGNTDSYLLVSSVSKNLTRNNSIVIPYDVVDLTYGLIVTPFDLAKLIDACIQMGIDDVNIDISSSDVRVPKNYNIVLDSRIMKAIITKNLTYKKEENSEYVSSYYSFAKDVEMTIDYQTQTIIILSDESLRTLFDAINIYNENGSLNIVITKDSIKNLSTENLKIVLKSSLFHIAISDMIIDLGIALEYIGVFTTEEIVYDISIPTRTFVKNVVSENDINKVLSYL